MRKFSKKQYLAAGAAAAVIIAGGGAAYAYWTTSGAGSGNSTTATSISDLTLHANFDATGLVPGGHVGVTYTADNANATSSSYVNTLTVTGVTVDSSHATDGCLSSDFTATAVTPTNGTLVAASSTGTTVGSGVLSFANTTADQSACKGATVTIAVSSS